MKRMLVLSMAMIMGAAASVASAAPSGTHGPISRRERCSLLDHQLTRAIALNHKTGRLTAARALRKKARRFCATRREAQGLRMYADALKSLGVTPLDPERARPTATIQSKEKRK